jgi:uncharacterized YigZ family protein
MTVYHAQAIEYSVQRSRFIAQAFALLSAADIEAHVEHMRQTFPKASHYVWAYRLEPGQERACDDGEPSGTAGSPVLKLLVEHQWDHTAVVVVRYFGGIKLGRGGLVRAYQTAAQLALEAVERGRLVEAWDITIALSYAQHARLAPELSTTVWNLSTSWADAVTCRFLVSVSDWAALVRQWPEWLAHPIAQKGPRVDIRPEP